MSRDRSRSGLCLGAALVPAMLAIGPMSGAVGGTAAVAQAAPSKLPAPPANGVGRHMLGIKPRSRAISGPGFWMKAGLAAGWKLSGAKKLFAAKIKPNVALDKEKARQTRKQPYREAAE